MIDFEKYAKLNQNVDEDVLLNYLPNNNVKHKIYKCMTSSKAIFDIDHISKDTLILKININEKDAHGFRSLHYINVQLPKGLLKPCKKTNHPLTDVFA